MEKAIIAFAAALCVVAGCVTGVGEASIAKKAVEAIGKNPEAADKIQSMSIIGAAISETCSIYCLLVAILLLLVY